jgi:thiosulfate/3-mercaptopyruvate sulfurtransferase
MIETFFGANLLTTFPALLSAFIIGIAFGWCLEQAGFGSSRKLTGIFYFRDMAVLKVMFSAAITAMLGLLLLIKIGVLNLESIYLPETFFGAQIFGGLLFGIGFVIGGWCPGTATVGAVSGKFDALVFLLGAGIGSLVFSESFVVVEKYYLLGSAGLRLAYKDLGISYGEMALAVTLVGIIAFWIAEMIEARFDFSLVADRTRGLWIFSFAAMIIAAGVSAMPVRSSQAISLPTNFFAMGADSIISPVDLAKEMLAGEKKIVCVDLRSEQEYQRWHIPGARNFPVESLIAALNRYRSYDRIVLYDDKMAQPFRVQVLLQLNSFKNTFVLDGGLKALFNQVLKPSALRAEPMSPGEKAEVEKWRSFFLTSAFGGADPVQFMNSAGQNQ